MYFSLVVEIPEWAFLTAFILVLSSLAIACVRIFRGPDVVNRIVALDLVAGLSLGLIVLLAIRFRQMVFLDVGFAIAVLSFIGTVAFALYLEKGGSEL